MNLHIVSLPHTQTTSSWLTCAYTQKIVKAGSMFTEAGHTVFIYSGEENEAVCAEHVPLVTERERRQWFAPRDANDANFGGVSWDPNHASWLTMNSRALNAIRARAASNRDLVLLIGGNCQEQIARHVKPLTSCEWGVGYEGIIGGDVHAAFESSAWMHYVYGKRGIVNGRAYDRVIPNFFEPSDFAVAARPSDYLLYIGRLVFRKGITIAREIATAADRRLVMAGPGAARYRHLRLDTADGNTLRWVDYRGPVEAAERARLYAEAACVLVPTIYVEPFGGVAVEAMLSGTPVVAPAYGAFNETVEDGVTGYRFHTLADAAAAVEACQHLDREKIRARALEKYSTAAVAPLYDRWFNQLDGLWGEGWYELPEKRAVA